MIANRVRASLALVMLAALAATGFLTAAPNRLVSGAPLMLWQAASPAFAAAIAILALTLLALSLAPPRRALEGAAAAAAGALMLVLLAGAGQAAARLSAGAPPALRIGLGPAFWIAMLAAALAIVDALQRLGAGPAARLAAAAAVTALLLLVIAAGACDQLSIVREYAARRPAFAAALLRHGELVLGALVPASALGVPLGALAVRRPGVAPPLFAVLNIVQTIPSIALFGLLIAPLSLVGHGVGFVPAAIALTLYALLPMARNTQAGLLGVDPALIEAARGMGMLPRQIFWRVEAPLAVPVLLAGLRITLVQAIGLATVAALIGAGGLGSFVFQGIGQYAVDLVLLGAVPIILLALAADFLLGLAGAASGRRQ